MANNNSNQPAAIEKAPTGIAGFDEITFGGLPKGRPTLVAGSAGSGKTMFGMEFLVRGATEFDEPGVFMSFEESVPELVKNFASIGFDLNELSEANTLLLDQVRIERSEIEETGEYDLEGLFIRLGYAIDSIGAKRVVLDTIEALFAGLANESILRAELRRLFQWLKDKGVTAIITGERGEGTITRHGLEEYVADCVILLDTRVTEQIVTRRMRIIKYRGSKHGSNEYPFLIDENGFSVLPITSLGLAHKVSNERISSGIARLDSMMGGQGFYRGSSILISGTAGSGKSSISASMAFAAGQRGEKCLYFSFEESQAQIIRNMLSIGLDLKPYMDRDILRFHTSRPSLFGLEMHLVTMHKLINDFMPSIVIIDPITNLISVGSEIEVKSMLTRLIDFLKSNGITAVFTSLTSGGGALEHTAINVSSFIDTWILLRDIESNGERNRGIYILKSRGMQHSNQIREFLITNKGIDLLDVYLSAGEFVMGSARATQESKAKTLRLAMDQDIKRKKRELERKQKLAAAQIAAIQSELEAQEEEKELAIGEELRREAAESESLEALSRLRKVDVIPPEDQGVRKVA